MNTIWNSSRPGKWAACWALAFLLLVCGDAECEVPLPDFVVYGTVAIQNKAVTNSTGNTNVTIYVNRLGDNQLLASYQMGSSTNQGKFLYVLRVPMEDAPASSLLVAEPNTPLIFMVKKGSVTQFTSTNILSESAQALRLDFGASIDTDGDGIPDGWATANGLSGALLGDTDNDGIPDYAEYVAGTSPNNAGQHFQLAIQKISPNATQISFPALLASGVGYEGRSRYYALEAKTNLNATIWATVPNYSRILGTNQTVTYNIPTNAVPGFYRGRVWLEGP
jgi:hypothetical protein